VYPIPAEDARTQFVNLFNILLATAIILPMLAFLAKCGNALGVSSDRAKAWAGNNKCSPLLRTLIDLVSLVVACGSILFVMAGVAWSKWRQRGQQGMGTAADAGAAPEVETVPLRSGAPSGEFGAGPHGGRESAHTALQMPQHRGGGGAEATAAGPRRSSKPLVRSPSSDVPAGSAAGGAARPASKPSAKRGHQHKSDSDEWASDW
jgi:hypothetical protein